MNDQLTICAHLRHLRITRFFLPPIPRTPSVAICDVCG